MTHRTYVLGKRYRISRDSWSGIGHIERLADGVSSLSFVCLEGAGQLRELRRVRRSLGASSFDRACDTYFAPGAQALDAGGHNGHIDDNGKWVKGD